MKKVKFCLIAMLVFISITKLFSQTILVSGDINSNTTWSADTVKIKGDVNVLPGIELVVEPGTYVESQGFFRINVAGSLKAKGTITDTIVFTVRDTTGFWLDEYSTAGGWAGFSFNNNTPASDTSIFEYCRIQYGKKYNINGDDIKGGVIKAINYGKLIISHSHLLCNMVINHEYTSAYGPVSKGGAIYCEHVNSIILTNNKFERNRSFDKGGAVFIGAECQSEISNNTFTCNKSWNFKIISGLHVSWGAGAAIGTYEGDGPSTKISGNYFYNNYTVDGVIHFVNQGGLIFNNLICNNFGTGISALYYFSTVRIFNNTIANNDSHMGGIYLYSNAKVYNNIVWGNRSFPGEVTDQIQKLLPGTIHPVLFNNCVQYGDGGANSIRSYPEFKYPSAGFGIEYWGSKADWSLSDISPSVNSGTPDTSGLFIPEFDIIGNPRIYGTRIEMGCYENQSVLTGIDDDIVNAVHPIVYPNPGTDKVNIESAENEIIFELITLTGQTVIRDQMDKGLNSINTESLTTGIYFYRLLNNKQQVIESGKWIKK
jgi:hypothetical protein